MAKQFATRLALIAFATVSLRGLMTAADFEGTLRTALIAAAGFYGLGWICGDLGRRVVEENVQIELVRMKESENMSGS